MHLRLFRLARRWMFWGQFPNVAAGTLWKTPPEKVLLKKAASVLVVATFADATTVQRLIIGSNVERERLKDMPSLNTN